MKLKSAVLALALCLFVPPARAKSSALDLLGKWEGSVEFGKFKFTLVLRVSTNSAGRVEATVELPEQGQTAPADALLFNSPEMRLEIDRFGTAYNGKVNSTFTEIDGEPVSMRLEGTASCVRACIENRLIARATPDIHRPQGVSRSASL